MRGMYVSLQATHIGQYALPEVKQNILGNPAKELALMKTLVGHNITSISIYDLNSIFANGMQEQLSNFIQYGILNGINRINAVIGGTNQITQVLAYNSKYSINKFTGLLSEFEFWNGLGTLAEFCSLLTSMKKTGLPVGAYLGWLNRQPQMTENQVAAQIAPLIDRLYLHCYVQDPHTAFQYAKTRVNAFLSVNKALEFVPMYSVEGPSYSAGSDLGMGPWLIQNSMTLAEDLFRTPYQAAYPYSYLTLKGFQYFEYGLLPDSVKLN